MAFDPEQFLKDYCSALGIDCSDLSPFTRYVIKPVVELYRKHFQEYTAVWDTIGNLADGKPEAVAPEALNFYLRMFGIPPITSTPTVGVIQLTATTEVAEALRFMSREYKDKEVTFEHAGQTYSCNRFTAPTNPNARATIIAEFYNPNPDAFVPVGTRVNVKHPDFVDGIVISCSPGKWSYSPETAIRFISERLTRSTYAANYDDLQLVSARALGLDTSDVAVVGANHPMMLADLISLSPRKHGGGIVDIYIPITHVDVTTNLTAQPYRVYKSYIEPYCTHPYIPYANDLLLAGAVPIDDTNAPKSFLGEVLDRSGASVFKSDDIPVAILEGVPVSDVISVTHRGQKLRENVDYAVVSLNRGTVFSTYSVVAIVFDTNKYSGPLSITVTYSRPTNLKTYEDLLQQHRYITAKIQLKCKIPVWLVGNVKYTGEVDFDAVQRALFKISRVETGVLVSILKSCGATSVSVSDLKCRLVSPGFGFFEVPTPAQLEDFKSIVPYPELLCFCVTPSHLRGD